MFKKLSVLLLALPIISALQLNQPTTQVNTSSPITVTWTTASGDPGTFDLYLTNSNFRNTFALKNTVQTSDLTITVTIPVVDPGPGYTFQASPVGDVNTVLSQTPAFDIGAASSSTLSPSSSSTSSGTGTVSGLSSLTPKSTPLTGTSSSTSSTTVPTGSFNGNNGALGMVGIGATTVGFLAAAGFFFAF